MKKRFVMFFAGLIIFCACAAPRPYYLTPEGKKKQDYYNDIQFGRTVHPKKKF